jgi:hypothetical protein
MAGEGGAKVLHALCMQGVWPGLKLGVLLC